MLKRIPVTDARVGMFVHELCGSWMDHSFWKVKFLLDSAKDLQRLQNSAIRELWIDTEKGLDVPGGDSHALIEARTNARLLAAEHELPGKARAQLADEMGLALKLSARTKERLVGLFSDMRSGAPIDSAQLAGQVAEINQSLQRHPHALISLVRLRSADEYQYMHALAVSALMIALARQLGMDEAHVSEAGVAGLLHDIGEALMPAELLNCPGKLSRIDSTLLRDHPALGAETLEKQGLSPALVDVCLHHHEKPDGSGYPERLAGEQISQLAKMCAVCDVYDALTCDRPYQKGLDPAEAMRKMAEWCPAQFDEQVFRAFVKALGIYPTGALVRLESGKLGVVLEQNEHSLLTPKVKVFFSARSKAPIEQEILDLSKLVGRERIVGREPLEDWGFRNLEELWSGERKGRATLFGGAAAPL
ncbi:MAG: HD-GYP domain-containing protein [Pseudomonas sp.]|uniref:HD-GYP domain-containing protein n=1 Tax=Pseudomonas sp. TaxID=306 RepID=UPI003BB67064